MNLKSEIIRRFAADVLEKPTDADQLYLLCRWFEAALCTCLLPVQARRIINHVKVFSAKNGKITMRSDGDWDYLICAKGRELRASDVAYREGA